MHGGINMNTRQQTVAKNRMPQQVGGQPIQNGIIEENSLPKVKHVLCNGIRIKIAFNPGLVIAMQ